MKFFGAILAYVVIGGILGWGILLGTTRGNWWFFVISLLAYVIAFAKIGCLPSGKSQH